jgi:hypothetical protein
LNGADDKQIATVGEEDLKQSVAELKALVEKLAVK